MMAVAEVKSPVYDDRVQEIIRSHTEGKSREEVAMNLDHSTWRSTDMYMRRKGFVWDPTLKNYMPHVTEIKLKEVISNAPPKVSLVMDLFNAGEPDPRSVARQVGFKDHRDMAEYMKNKGYVWSSDDGNYVEFAGEIMKEPATDSTDAKPSGGKVLSLPTAGSSEQADLARYLPLLHILERNKERLLDLLMPASDSGTVPHFAVPGTVRTKSVYMSDRLSSLVGQFCEGRNITQKQVYEAAMIEYLMRYGFKLEVDTLLKKV